MRSRPHPAEWMAALLLTTLAVQAAPPEDWPVALGDAGQRHYSALSQIHTGNVARLRVAWTYRSGDGSPQNR